MNTKNKSDYKLVLDISDRISEEDFHQMIREVFASKKMDMRKVIPISMRKALIITIEEQIVCFLKKRKELNFKRLENTAKSNFNIKNRELRAFRTLDDINPENPCLKYENDNRRKSHYKRSIFQILMNNCWLLKNDKLNQKFKSIYEEVDLC